MLITVFFQKQQHLLPTKVGLVDSQPGSLFLAYNGVCTWRAAEGLLAA